MPPSRIRSLGATFPSLPSARAGNDVGHGHHAGRSRGLSSTNPAASAALVTTAMPGTVAVRDGIDHARLLECSCADCLTCSGNSLACGATWSMFGVMSASNRPSAHDSPPSRICSKILLDHTSSRWPREV